MSKISDNDAIAGLLQTRLNQRGENLVIDYKAGPKTRAALDKHLPDLGSKAVVNLAALQLSSNASQSDKHYALAVGYVGTKELPGKATHPALVPMFDLTPQWLDQDDSITAWCGIFRGYIGHKAGTGMPSAHYRAAAWLDWGTKVDHNKPSTWKKGDTVIMKRDGGYHVALFDRLDGKNVWYLGGNQSNAVNVSKYPLSLVVGVRR